MDGGEIMENDLYRNLANTNESMLLQVVELEETALTFLNSVLSVFAIYYFCRTRTGWKAGTCSLPQCI